MNEPSGEYEITVNETGAGKRLDQFLPGALAAQGLEKSRSQLKELIQTGFVLLNGRQVKPRTEIATGDLVKISVPEPESVELLPEAINLSVMFEDDDLIVIDKAPGIVVHPGSGNQSGTLVNALLHHCDGKLSQLADEGRPGIVHRLDKETSGCLIAAKSDRAYVSLVKQFSNRETKKFTTRLPAVFPGRAVGGLKIK